MKRLAHGKWKLFACVFSNPYNNVITKKYQEAYWYEVVAYV